MLTLDEFEKLLREYKDEQFLVVDLPGTKGDQLILMGMIKKFEELGISYEIFHYTPPNLRVPKLKRTLSWLRLNRQIAKKVGMLINKTANLVCGKLNRIRSTSADVVVLRGGGYLNDIWNDYHVLKSIIENAHDRTLIFAPHSFFFKSTSFLDFFKRCKQPTHIFCREKYSYDLLRSIRFPKNVRIHLSHDTSLYLSKSDFAVQKWKESYILIAPRNDKESAVIWKMNKIPRKTKILFGDVIHVRDFNAYVNIIGNASQVYTDRLHNAILSAILGKETFLYPNSYHKNRGVYEFSLQNFPNVRFVDSYEFLGLTL